MDTHTPEPTAALPTISSYATRHDGWTDEKMAIFCETLAETRLACARVGSLHSLRFANSKARRQREHS
jgi:hypothetical protein